MPNNNRSNPERAKLLAKTMGSRRKESNTNKESPRNVIPYVGKDGPTQVGDCIGITRSECRRSSTNNGKPGAAQL
eukprot:31491-Amphidinium_carterae.1